MKPRDAFRANVARILSEKQLTSKSMTAAAGKRSTGWASNLLGGRTDTPIDTAAKIADFLGVPLWQLLISEDELKALEPQATTIPGFSPVRWLKSPIAAGEPLAMAAADEDPRYLAFQDRFLRHFSSPLCLTVGPREQSMLPTIQPSDVVVIDQALDARATPMSGQIYAVNLAALTGEPGGTLKRIEASDDHLVVIADNQDKTRYRTRAFDLEGIVLPQVLVGRVVWIGRTIGDRRIKK